MILSDYIVRATAKQAQIRAFAITSREIVETARKIDTFETSTLPYEDCCTVFTPRHPKVRPNLEDVERAQNRFDFEPLLEEAVAQTTLKVFKVEA